MLDFPSLLYKGLRILMFQLSGVYCTVMMVVKMKLEVSSRNIRKQDPPKPKMGKKQRILKAYLEL